jgi:hypothetical protein
MQAMRVDFFDDHTLWAKTGKLATHTAALNAHAAPPPPPPHTQRTVSSNKKNETVKKAREPRNSAVEAQGAVRSREVNSSVRR